MQAYIARRLAALVPTLLFASLIVFISMRLIPGDVIDLMLAQNDIATGQDRAKIEAALGLDQPMYVQYFRWIWGVLQGDLGISLWQNVPVADQLLATLPITFELGFLALLVALTVALPIGIYSAMRQDTAGDYVARSFSLLMLAVPGFWLGTLVMVFPSVWWRWAPDLEYTPFFEDPLKNLSHMIVPAILLGLSMSAVTMRMTRTMMLEVLRQDYIRTAGPRAFRSASSSCATRCATASFRSSRSSGCRRRCSSAARSSSSRSSSSPAWGCCCSKRCSSATTGGVRGVPGRRRGRAVHQPGRGRELRLARPEGPAPVSEAALSGVAGVGPRPPGRLGALWEFLARLGREKPLGAAGGVVFLVFLLCGIFADVLAPYGINETNLAVRLQPPSLDYPLGTDHLGRDVLSRILMGAQLSMIVSFVAAGLATVVSLVIGVVSGYFGGRTDMVVQRGVDAWMTFPDLVLLIVIVSVVGPGIPQIVLVLGLLYGIAGSRIVRGAVVSVKENMYTHAAQSIGARTFHILWRHIVPNVMPVLIVLFTTRIGAVILTEAGLSFLGLGVPPPAPTWGAMLSGTGRTYMYLGPWLALAPGLCLTIVVYAINVYGDALRDLLDPRMRGSQ